MSFTSIMKAIGKDVEKVFLSPWFQTGVHLAEGVIGLAVPALGPAFNLTAQAVMTAEANFAAVGQASGTGASKLASVIATSGNLIAQCLKDSGAQNVTQDKVAGYINAVVAILNAAPTPNSATPTP